MLTAISHKTKQFLLVLIKLSLVVAAFYFIYSKLFQNKNLSFVEFIHNLINYSSFSTNIVVVLVFLSILNWFFEINKWQALVSSVTEISWIEAKSQSLGALTASLLTPNRIGDYGAKAMYYLPQYRKKIMFLNLLGNCAQMGITTIFGTVGLIYFAHHHQPQLDYYGILIWLTGIGIIGFLSIWTLKTTWLNKQAKTLYRLFGFLTRISNIIIFKVVLYSLVRYLIFSFQFYYLLALFGIDMSYFEAMAAIASMYVLSSIIPSIFIFDVIIKGGVAVYVFGLIGVSESIVLSIITFMWILNFVLPSIIGSYHVLRFKLPKTAS
ncbi:lysylphosphatidylglycerol synthase domain-containing protein [Gelidibacter sp. F63206]|uniref:lysylphosphatidylglycerol synthase domain-containing protein n=1 Tax=Gelidibacter sp. F63206 TaxID=2926425 RepID=UPI001FF12E5B|nr:lysylphosphatidylglycerol synthase domain-containing protein [Gelidibacter sp. F63206]MCK0114577.1 flippase-like domain-containing protein [Gelidibacter sp. F63206]